MPVIKGMMVDKDGDGVKEALVCLKGKRFENLYTTMTNEFGEYEMEITAGDYPYLMSVKEYGTQCLEFWCQDLVIDEELIINGVIDQLEIYGLKVFKVDGAYPALMVYFRPMSLQRVLECEENIAPEVASIEIKVNKEELTVYVVNEVEEFIGEGETLRAYLMHVSMPRAGLKDDLNYLSLKIQDVEEHIGVAGTFFSFHK